MLHAATFIQCSDINFLVSHSGEFLIMRGIVQLSYEFILMNILSSILHFTLSYRNVLRQDLHKLVRFGTEEIIRDLRYPKKIFCVKNLLAIENLLLQS